MKKVILAICLLIGGSQLGKAQVQFGIKGGINYNSDSFKEITTTDIKETNSKTGFHAGIWTRIKIPIIGFYLRPELVYTSLKSEVVPKDTSESKAKYQFQKIDIPVLFGKKIFGVGNIFIGPSFQYILKGDLTIPDTPIEEFSTKSTGFTVGLQLGGGLELGKFGLDIRWERAFSDIASKLISNGNPDFNFDTRVNQIIIGLSYRL